MRLPCYRLLIGLTYHLASSYYFNALCLKFLVRKVALKSLIFDQEVLPSCSSFDSGAPPQAWYARESALHDLPFFRRRLG